MIECDCLLTVKQIIGRGKKNREEVFQYPVYYMFDKFSKKWWPSLDKKNLDQVPSTMEGQQRWNDEIEVNREELK